VDAAFMRGALAALTGREREVLALLSQGLEGHVLADALGLSPNTVRTHVQNMLDKLQVHSRLEAIALLRASEVA
ncbi:MAG: helix-turn-helix transcriptional regulator, partial [Actinomycetota bacterium]